RRLPLDAALVDGGVRTFRLARAAVDAFAGDHCRHRVVLFRPAGGVRAGAAGRTGDAPTAAQRTQAQRFLDFGSNRTTRGVAGDDALVVGPTPGAPGPPTSRADVALRSRGRRGCDARARSRGRARRARRPSRRVRGATRERAPSSPPAGGRRRRAPNTRGASPRTSATRTATAPSSRSRPGAR